MKPHLLLPVLLLSTLACACGKSEDTADTDGPDNPLGELEGSDAFEIASAISWSRIPVSETPAQLFVVLASWEMNCTVFNTWEENHWPVQGDGSFVYLRLMAYDTPYTGTYDHMEGDEDCINSSTFEVTCDYMISEANWGEITAWTGDGEEAEFEESAADALAPVASLSVFDEVNTAGTFDFDGLVSGSFSAPYCGDGY